MTALALALTRPRAERPWWLRRPGMLAIGALVLIATLLGALASPQPAQGFLGVDVNPASWAVKGFAAIIDFLFGKEIRQLGTGLMKFLLATPDITNPNTFRGLSEYYDVVQGAAWGLLSLAFIAATLTYWSSSYTANGADLATRAFARTIGGIGMLVSLPEALHLTIGAMNALTMGLSQNSAVAGGFSKTLTATLTLGLTNGGIPLLVGVAALIAALVLMIVKIITTALLAIFFILAPLAIGVWPFEPLAWALRSLASAALALLVFPVVWAACFGVFAVCTPAALAGPGAGHSRQHPDVNRRARGTDRRLQAAVRRSAPGHERGHAAQPEPRHPKRLLRALHGGRGGGGGMNAREQHFRSSAEPFQHLQDREVVLWGLTFVQLLYLALGVLLAFAFAMWISPLSGQQTAFVCILLAGLPPMLSWIATEGDIAPWTMTRACLRWLRSPRRFAPGGSRASDGYVVERPAPAETTARGARAARSLEDAWEL